MEELMRLQKAMSQKGICSRRQAEVYIKENKVKVNGVIVSEMGHLVSLKDKIEVIGLSTNVDTTLVTFLFNKPLGVVSSVKDDRGRKTVIDFFKNENYRLYPVGRLDYNTSGALLISNDGELTSLVTHPSTHLSKTYIVTIRGAISDAHLEQLRKGILLEDGMTAPAKVSLIARNQERSIISLTIHEGRNRQVRRMMEALSYEVKNLHREKISFLDLTNIKRGEYRLLSQQEVEMIKKLCKENKKNNIIPDYKLKK
jgi:23S rRNA pseudouridine2605 synthase